MENNKIPTNISNKSDNEQKKHTKKTNCFFNPVLLQKDFVDL